MLPASPDAGGPATCLLSSPDATRPPLMGHPGAFVLPAYLFGLLRLHRYLASILRVSKGPVCQDHDS